MLPDAACHPFHTDFWFPPFPEDRLGKELEYQTIAKYICAQCSIRDECRRLGKEEEYGVWGGWTPRERRRGGMKMPLRQLPKAEWHVIPGPLDGHPDPKEVLATVKTRVSR